MCMAAIYGPGAPAQRNKESRVPHTEPIFCAFATLGVQSPEPLVTSSLSEGLDEEISGLETP
jgi:hypothetical protein